MEIVDLTMPIEDHLRWKVDRKLVLDFARDDQFQATWVGWTVHGFTHMDAPRHMLPDGPTTDDTSLERVVGPCAVLDLSGAAEPKEALTADHLSAAAAASDLQPGDKAILKTCWDERRSYRDATFWTDAPFLTREAATWLLEARVSAVAFDFPQDYPIRLLLDDYVAPIDEYVTHDVLLRNGVILIEYIVGTAGLTRPRTFLCALPLNVPGADGAPARVVAMQPGPTGA